MCVCVHVCGGLLHAEREEDMEGRRGEGGYLHIIKVRKGSVMCVCVCVCIMCIRVDVEGHVFMK